MKPKLAHPDAALFFLCTVRCAESFTLTGFGRWCRLFEELRRVLCAVPTFSCNVLFQSY